MSSRTLLYHASFPLSPSKGARDEFQFNYASNEKSNIQNDTVTIDYRLARSHLIKISISHALAQSTKLVHLRRGCWTSLLIPGTCQNI